MILCRYKQKGASHVSRSMSKYRAQHLDLAIGIYTSLKSQPPPNSPGHRGSQAGEKEEEVGKDSNKHFLKAFSQSSDLSYTPQL